MSTWVRDVTDATFEAEVLERSRTMPVVVDFWAPWCGPCRTLGPVLERLAEAHGGEFLLAKVDVDQNPGVAQALGIQGIPAVKAFRGGRLVDEFTGALPEESVRVFLARLLPTDADRFAARAADAAARGAADEAERLYRQALDLDVNHPAARLGLAKQVLARDEAAGLEELEKVLAGTPERAEADRLAARRRIAAEGRDGRGELERRITANPADLEARLELGRLLAAEERYEDALGQFLEVVRRDRTYEDDAARKAMLDVFEVLGPGNDLAGRYQGELARILFS